MKKILIGLIIIYQKIPGPFHSYCRHIPTCSNYGIEAINEHGTLRGSFLTIKRILKCNPFTKGGYDPVPRRSEKKMKKLLILLVTVVMLSSLTGCFRRDNFEGIEIYTTAYPIEYITSRLYGNHSEIKSIYPDGVNINDFTLNEKQITDYSKAGLYIFNGLSKEKDYVVPMVNINDNIKIIDTTLSMEYIYGMEELWLDPSNLLMIAKNIDTGFNEYIENYYLKDEISTNYEQLKIELSELDAKLRLMAESSDDKTIVVGNDVFKYLEKYGFTVISLDETEALTDKIINDVHNLIVGNKVNYIYIKKGTEANQYVKNFKSNYNIEILELHSLSNISETERENKEDYFTLMNNNMDLLKNELYN